MRHRAYKMARHLEIYAELKKPVRVKKDSNDKYTQSLQEVKRIPKDVHPWFFKLPFYQCSNGIVKREPNAQQQVSSFPDSRYVINKFQADKIDE
jgi:hypothetical protein